MTNKRSSQSGQIALAVLLIMMVVLVVSVAVATRTTKDIAQSTQTAEAAQVFSVAESGAEQKLNEVIMDLQNGTVPPNTSGSPVTSGNVQVTTSLTSSNTLDLELAQGESAQVQLGPTNTVTKVKITWAFEEVATKRASLIVSEYYTDAGVVKVKYTLLAPCNTIHNLDGFTLATGCPSPYGNPSSETLNLQNNGLFVRIQSVYTGTHLMVEGADGILPAQQFLVRTEAVNTATDIQENAALEVTATHLLPPPFLDYVLYSGGSIEKP